MANQGSENFYRSLRASIKHKPDPETDKLYQMKLAKWRMTGPQWDCALDQLLHLEESKDGRLPSLSFVFDALKHAQAETKNEEGLGWCSFEYFGRAYVFRVKSVNGIWKEMECIIERHPKEGEWPFGKKVWTGAVREMVIPDSAINVNIRPDKLAPMERDEDNPDPDGGPGPLQGLGELVKSME
jgi:hypothetical protein